MPGELAGAAGACAGERPAVCTMQLIGPRTAAVASEHLIIGWIGTSPNLAELQAIEPALRAGSGLGLGIAVIWLSLIVLLQFGGAETPSHLIGTTLWELHTNPDAMATVKADRARYADAIEGRGPDADPFLLLLVVGATCE